MAFAVFRVDSSCDPKVFDNIQDAIDAAAAYDDSDHADCVWIANTTAYTGQHIVVADTHTVIIEGGFSDRNDFDPGVDFTVVNGADPGRNPRGRNADASAPYDPLQSARRAMR